MRRRPLPLPPPGRRCAQTQGQAPAGRQPSAPTAPRPRHRERPFRKPAAASGRGQRHGDGVRPRLPSARQRAGAHRHRSPPSQGRLATAGLPSPLFRKARRTAREAVRRPSPLHSRRADRRRHARSRARPSARRQPARILRREMHSTKARAVPKLARRPRRQVTAYSLVSRLRKMQGISGGVFTPSDSFRRTLGDRPGRPPSSPGRMPFARRGTNSRKGRGNTAELPFSISHPDRQRIDDGSARDELRAN